MLDADDLEKGLDGHRWCRSNVLACRMKVGDMYK